MLLRPTGNKSINDDHDRQQLLAIRIKGGAKVANSSYQIINIEMHTGHNHNNNSFQDKFSQYLSLKIGPHKAQTIMPTATNEMSNTPIRSSFQPSNLSFTESIDSSALSFSNSLTVSNSKAKTSYGKTISVKKKLRKMRDVEDKVCSICLESPKERVEMSCGHEYCHDCLSQWLQTSSRCPYCREDCKYFRRDGVNYEIKQKQFEYEEDGNVGFDFECYLCGETQEGDTVIICDECEVHACHPGCDPQLRGRIPSEEEEWYCHFCRH